MKKSKRTPNKHIAIALSSIAFVLFLFSPDCTWAYWLGCGFLILYIGWVIGKQMDEFDSKRASWVLVFPMSTFITSVILVPILYFLIPNIANKYIITEIAVVEKHKAKKNHTFIWNSPIRGIDLSADEKYILNKSDEPIFIISAEYAYRHAILPFTENGLQLLDVIQPEELIQNTHDIYSYLEIPPDSITVKMRRYSHSSYTINRSSNGLSSPKTYFFVVSKDQYLELRGFLYTDED